jgi:hypothetical protein
MFFNSAVQSGAGNAQVAGGVRNIAGMLGQRFLHHHFLQASSVISESGKAMAFSRRRTAEIKIFGLQGALVAENYGPFYGVLQFPDVARPVVFG